MRLFLIDGHACCYKYYYGYFKNPLLTSYGENVSVAYGMAKLLSVLFLGFDMSHIAVIFDPPTGSWRKKIYKEYKATRKTPDDISPHIARTFELVQAWGIYTNAFEYLEADDVIAAIAKKAEQQGFEVVIVTKDKDYAQLVTKNVKLLDLGKTIGKDSCSYIDLDGVKERWGVNSNQILDFLAIVGDSSDNIKGVKGVGKGTAQKLLEKYGTAANIYTNLDQLTKAQKNKFIDYKKDFELAQTLVRLKDDVELPFTLDRLEKPDLNRPKLLTMLQQLEFNSIIKDIGDI